MTTQTGLELAIWILGCSGLGVALRCDYLWDRLKATERSSEQWQNTATEYKDIAEKQRVKIVQKCETIDYITRKIGEQHEALRKTNEYCERLKIENRSLKRELIAQGYLRKKQKAK